MVLLRVEFEIEEAIQVTTGAATSAPSAALPECNLNVPASGFRAQKMLKSFLLRRDGHFPVVLLQGFHRLPHRFGGFFHILGERLKLGVLLRKLTALHTIRQRAALVAEFGLHVRKELRVLGFRGFILALVANLVKGRGDDFFLAFV